ncbi:unnamed protein product [Pylaiella littoralis]
MVEAHGDHLRWGTQVGKGTRYCSERICIATKNDAQLAPTVVGPAPNCTIPKEGLWAVEMCFVQFFSDHSCEILQPTFDTSQPFGKAKSLETHSIERHGTTTDLRAVHGNGALL